MFSFKKPIWTILTLSLFIAMTALFVGCHDNAAVGGLDELSPTEAAPGEAGTPADIVPPGEECVGEECGTEGCEGEECEVEEPTTLSITTSALAPGTFGAAYSQAVEVEGGSEDNTIELTGLPTGLSFSDGSIEGAPEQTGTFPITVKLTDPESAAVVESTFDLLINKEIPNLSFRRKISADLWQLLTGDIDVAGDSVLGIIATGNAAGYQWSLTGTTGDICLTNTPQDIIDGICHPLGATASKLVAVFKPTAATSNMTFTLQTQGTENSEPVSKEIKFQKTSGGFTPLEPIIPPATVEPPSYEFKPIPPVMEMFQPPKIKKVEIKVWTQDRKNASLTDGYPVIGFYNGPNYTDCKDKLCDVALTVQDKYATVENMQFELGKPNDPFENGKSDKFTFEIDPVSIDYFKYFRLKIKDKSGHSSSNWFLQKIRIKVQDTDGKWHTTYYNPCVDKWLWGNATKWNNYGKDDWGFCAEIATAALKHGGTDTSLWLILDTEPLGTSGVSYDGRDGRDPHCMSNSKKPQSSPWFRTMDLDFTPYPNTPNIEGDYYTLKLDYRRPKKDGKWCTSWDDLEKGDHTSYGGVIRAPWNKPPEVRICMYKWNDDDWDRWKMQFIKMLAFRPSIYFANPKGKIYYEVSPADAQGKNIGKGEEYDGLCFPRNHWWKLKEVEGKDIYDYSGMGGYVQ